MLGGDRYLLNKTKAEATLISTDVDPVIENSHTETLWMR